MRIISRSATLVALPLLLLALWAPDASADSISWLGPVSDEKGQSNGNDNIADQLGLDVTLDSGVVTFTFTNDVGTASNITEIYFEDALKDWLDFDETITLTQGTTGSSTPVFTFGGATPAAPSGLGGTFTVGAGGQIAADSQNGNGKGINESEDWVKIKFDFIGDSDDFADMIAALGGVSEYSDALIAMHIRSIGDNGGSDVYYTGSTTPVPEPGTIVLMGTALLGFGLHRRRRS